MSGHVFGQAEGVEFLGYRELDDLLQGVFGVAGAELPRVAMMGVRHLERWVSEDVACMDG